MAASVTWFYRGMNDEKIGPVTQDEICELFRRGVLGLETLVRSDAFKNWTPAKSIAGLRALIAPQFSSQPAPTATLGNTPPPIPPTNATGASPFFSSPAIQTLDYATPTESDGPRGIGGWLILPAIGMVLNPLRLIGQTVLLWLAADKIASMLPTTTGDPRGLMQILSLASGILLIYQLYTSYVFFAKKRCAPGAVIGLFVFNIIVAFFSLVATKHMMPALPNNEVATLAPPVIIALIWGSYFKNSQRVKNTFVN